jgi:peptidoglycan/LPS O-acetylase OafA/YrhL
MEIRISLIFPVLMLLIKYANWKITLLVGYLLSLIYYLFIYQSQTKEILAISSDYYYTLAFISMFILGALLAKYRDFLIIKTKEFSRLQKILFLFFATLLYTIRYWPVFQPPSTVLTFLYDVSISLGVGIYIIFAVAKAGKILQHKILLFFGKISYSVYLYHAIILLALVYLLYPRVPMYLLWILGFTLTICVSYLSYKYVEQPAIRLGSILVRNVSPRSYKKG